MIISTLLRKFEAQGLKQITKVQKQDLDALNHLGANRNGITMLKLSFDTVQQLMDVRRNLLPIIAKNKQKEKETSFNILQFQQQQQNHASMNNNSNFDPVSSIIDIREYDVPYLVRVCIDLEIRVGAWYTVTPNLHDIGVTLSDQDIETKAEPKYLAFDIECTKAPLKFPDSNIDSIFMISYMVDGQGYLIISRQIVGADIQDFEYTPKPKYPGKFKIFNELDEEGLIRRFLSEYQRLRPQIVVTYNGDFFDWPFLEARAALYGLDLRVELGVERVSAGAGGAGGGALSEAEYRGRTCVHLDAFNWVKRDSYLPQGAQGLKAVTKYKLGYDPVEVDPEDMVRFAKERPIHMASYSVSDAVATYYLYMKYVHMFIFSLCTIIPMGPEDVLRKGSGTLCEALLMVQACTKDIICPNKQKEPLAKFHQGHLLESETYIGGKVECLETGVYRSDIEYKFDLQPDAFQQLIDNIDRDLTFAIEVEGGIDRNTITNYDEVSFSYVLNHCAFRYVLHFLTLCQFSIVNKIRCQIIEQLEMLRDRPKRTEKPFVYHLDIGAMYPNIILTNRLQPSAIVDDSICAACDFNQAKNDCKRKLEWVWRGDYNPATKGEYDRAKDQLSHEKFEDGKSFHQLDEATQAKLVATRLKQYSKNAYNKTKVTEEVIRKDTVCMRENDFYVNTVRSFRDKRYVLKKLTKVWGKKVKGAKDAASKKEAEDKALVYDSLQVAHKCILNSFYGYVMRKGARWRSMEMAGIVTKTGADMIVQARNIVERIGRPLELDTDGIWCILPKSFPDNFYFTKKDGSTLKLEYPCIMLNADVHDHFTNHQYQTLVDPKKQIYESRSECSIFFEVDGPYRCMVIPASTEEGKLLKKRYAVFNDDGSLAELKGFELKRRGELELIKQFQSQVFERFLNGNDLVECYDSVAEIANYWIDVLDTQGESLETDELVDLISENRSMSRQLEDYGDQKGTSQTTARRLGEFLGAEIVKDKGLNCKFIIAEKPHGSPVTERAIPTNIWKAEPAVMKHYIRKWLKSPGMDGDDFDIRNVLDWEYYRDRLGKTIQKIITIPAALQKVPNPVPRIPHPEWLQKTVRRLNDRYQQRSIKSMFGPVGATSKNKEKPLVITDIEDMVGANPNPGLPTVHQMKRSNRSESSASKFTLSPRNDADEEKDLPKVSLSKNNFNEWLARKKKTWNFRDRRSKRLQREESTNQEDQNEHDSKKQRKAMNSMTSYIKDVAQSLTNFEWHVIEIRDLSSDRTNSSGSQFLIWVMLTNGSLQKLQISVPRILYVNCREEVKEVTTASLSIRRVEKFLPHNHALKYLYEVSMPDHLYDSEEWLDVFSRHEKDNIIDCFYEINTTSYLRALVATGSICRVDTTAKGGRYSLSDFKRIEQPKQGEYLSKDMAYRTIFLYEAINPRSRTGLMAIFIMEGKGNDVQESKDENVVHAKCQMWVIKPGGDRGQRSISKRQCDSMFTQLLQQMEVASDTIREYSTLSSQSSCTIDGISFVNNESRAFKGMQEKLNSYSQGNNGPTLLLLNCSKQISQFRKSVPSCNQYPLVQMPLPPGVTNDSSILPSLNWEPHAAQMCFEAHLYMYAVSLPKRLNQARFSHIPIGNLGLDADITTYDITFLRLLQKNRALSWASNKPGCPDTGYNSLPLVSGSNIRGLIGEQLTDAKVLDSNVIWGDENENIKPVVSVPGAYRSICVEIDLHDLAIAAITDIRGINGGISTTMGKDAGDSMQNGNSPLGDEMSTAISLPLLRNLAQHWLRDASEYNSAVADHLLSNFYRLISSPQAALSDPALHRVVLSLMKSAFNQLLGEFQRLGCIIVFATFSRIVVATNKSKLSDAKEYIDFIISTVQKSLSDGDGVDGFARLSLEPRSFHSHYIFLDQHNYGSILFENKEPQDDEEAQWAFNMPMENMENNQTNDEVVIVPTVISAWNLMHYLPSDLSKEYFRGLIARFSKDVYRKQMLLEEKEESSISESNNITHKQELIQYKKKMISRHFASDITRAVSEILKDGGGPESFPKLPGSHLDLYSPVVEFVKNVLRVLELDKDVDTEVQIIKKSLFAQIGIEEYSPEAKWKNPCSSFILPDVFCVECQESRDIDLSVLPSIDEDNDEAMKCWVCEDCNTAYDIESIESRLVDMIEKKCIRYQLQDLRSRSNGLVSRKVLSHQSSDAKDLDGDISYEDVRSQLLILNNLASFYELEWLFDTTEELLAMS